MLITLPFKTPTINHLYGQHGFRKFLKPEARKLREEIERIIKGIKSKGEYLKPTQPLEVHIKVYEDWYTKKGVIKRKDIANREKFLIDSVTLALGIDDKLIFKHTMEKIQSKTEKCTLEFKAYITSKKGVTIKE